MTCGQAFEPGCQFLPLSFVKLYYYLYEEESLVALRVLPLVGMDERNLYRLNNFQHLEVLNLVRVQMRSFALEKTPDFELDLV